MASSNDERVGSTLLSRRAFTWGGAVAVGAAAPALVGCSPGLARAASSVAITAPSRAVAALVRSLVPAAAKIELAIQIDADQREAILVEGEQHRITERVLLKGSGAARWRYLDDPRNATTVASAIRDALAASVPGYAARATAYHRAWGTEFARRTLRWNERVRKAGLAGRAVRDDHGRIYALEWAGAKIDPGGSPPPAALGKLPTEPASTTPEAYVDYVESIVAALGG